MSTAAAALRAAIHDALVADGALTALLGGPKVYDEPPQSADFPYVTLGEARIADFSAGGVTRSYAAVMTLWASVEPVSARGAVVADAPGATVTHRIVMRRRAAITTRHRFVEGTTIYRIVTLREDATRRFLVIGAEQRAD